MMKSNMCTRTVVSIVLCFLIVVTALPNLARPALAAQSGDFTYELIDNGANVSITDYIGSSTSVVIPSTIDGKNVTKIGDQAFFGYEDLTKVTIPDNVTSIGDNAFWGCKNLTIMTLPPNLTTIGIGAFWHNNLSKITIPASVVSVDFAPFLGCGALTAINVDENNTKYSSKDGVLYNKDKTILVQYPIAKSGTTYKIEDSVTIIGESAFYGCKGLTSIEFPDNLIKICDDALYCFSGLTTISLGSNVALIGEHVFPSDLYAINIAENNEIFSSLDGVLFNKDKTKLILYPDLKTDTSYIIPDSVTHINDYAFDSFNNSNLISLTLSSNLSSIGTDAFAHCSKLTTINIAESNEYFSTIDSVLFNKSKTDLIFYPLGKTATSYVVPDSVKSLHDYAFIENHALTSLTIPKSVTSFGIYVLFVHNYSLKIYGEENSSAQQFAAVHAIPFIVLPTAEPTPTPIPTTIPTELPTPTLAPTPTATPVATPLIGDATGDGRITSADALKILQSITGKVILTDAQKIAADVTKNGLVQSSDALKVLHYCSGKITHV